MKCFLAKFQPGGVLALLVVQIPVGWAVFLAGLCAKSIWTEGQGMLLAQLPMGTILAIRLGTAIPMAAFAACVMLWIRSRRKHLPCLKWISGVAICEIVLLAWFALALVEPALRIMYHIGNV